MIHGGDCFGVYKIIFITPYKDEVNLHQKVIAYLLTFYLALVLLTTLTELRIMF